MRKQSYRRLASFLMFLVISIPFYTASVFGQIESIDAKGKAGISNFINENDQITFKAVIKMQSDPQITTNQVLLGNTLQFDSCAPGTNGVECMLKFPKNSTTIFDSGPLPYTVTLKNDANAVVEEETRTIYVDTKPPVFTLFTVDQAQVASGMVVLDMTVQDAACSASACLGKCSGISRIEIYEVDKSLKETIAVNSNSCTVQQHYEISTSKFIEGSHTLVVKAYDLLQQPSLEQSVTFDLDKSAPYIDPSTFKVTDGTEYDLSYSGVNEGARIVHVDIRDANLDLGSVKADFSDIASKALVLNANPTDEDFPFPLALNVANVSGLCEETETGINRCYWVVIVKPKISGVKQITINAKDKTGNPAKNIIAQEFKLDDNAPIVLSLETARVVNGQSYANLVNNTIKARFKDEAGMAAEDTKLLINNQEVIASTCNPQGQEWICAWDNVAFTSAGTKTVTLTTNSKDRVGNALGASFSEEIIVDGTIPKIISIKIRGVGGSQGTFDNITKSGDKLQIEAVVEDDLIVRGVADFSRFIVGAYAVEADSCEKIAEKRFVCSWTTQAIDIPGFIRGNVIFDFFDISNNKLHTVKEHTVYGIDGTDEPDFWTHTVVCSPQVLDRETMPLVSQRSFCHVVLKPKAVANITFGNLKTASIDLGKCSGDTSSIASADLFNDQFGSTDPYIRVNFVKQLVKVDSISISCPLSIVTIRDKDVVIKPETENVAITFRFYNMPLGEVASNVQSKIDSAISDADNALKIATFLKKILFYAEEICKFINTIEQVVVAWNLIKNIVGKAETAATGTPLKAPTMAQRQALCLGTEKVNSFVNSPDGVFGTLNKFCKFVNCQQTPGMWGTSDWLGWAGDWQTWGESQLNDIGGEFAKDWTGKDLSSYMNGKSSIGVALLTACIPGIIYGLDKYRQIQCMYADCLITAVGKEGLPVYACEDQKSYATCKYVVGELFQIIPFTALFNYYANLLKSVLSDPFKTIGFGLSLTCQVMCSAPSDEPHTFCRSVKLASILGKIVEDITRLFDGDAFKVRDDYCKVIEDYKTSKSGTTTATTTKK